MRFIKRFLLVFFLAIILAAGGYGVFIEGRAQWAAWELKRDFSLVRQLAARPQHYKDCLLDSLAADEFVLKGYQLRFVDERSYVVEAVCASSQKGLLTVRETTLPLNVTKLGGSGVYIPVPNNENIDAAVIIKSGWRLLAVGFFDNQVMTKLISDPDLPQEFGEASAITTCQGWGFRCCDELSQVGAGAAPDGVSDCAGGCYQQCLDKPLLVLFATDPLMNAATRTVDIRGARASVGFSYAIDDPDGKIVKTKIDFGDGDAFEDTQERSSAIHEYVCNQTACNFVATLTAVDNDNLPLAESRLSQITVRLTRN